MNFFLPVATLWKRELVRFWRQKSRILGVVASPLIFWLVIGSGWGDLSFFFPGTLVLTVMFSAIFSSITIIEDRREGFLLSMLVSPAPRSSMVLGKILGSATLAWIQGMVLLLFAPLAGLTPQVPALLPLAGVIFLIAFTLAGLGFLIAWKFDSTQGFHAVMNLLLLPMWLVSGSVFAMSSAHGWIRWVMWANPLSYALSLMRHLLPESAGEEIATASTSLLVTIGFGLAMLAASTMLARRKGAAA